MAIIWKSAMSVKNDLIDHDHHFLFNLINTIELIMLTTDDKSMLLEVIEQLYLYAVNHFRREESIQRKIEYPKSLLHKNEHNSLLRDLKNLQKEIEETKTFEEIKERSDHINDFLRKWLINHVFDEDMKLKPLLENHPKGFS